VANRVVGLELGRYSVKAVVLQVGFRTWELLEVAEELVQDDVPVPEAASPASEGDEGDSVLPEPSVDGSGEGLLLSAGILEAVRRLKQRGVLDGDATYVAAPRDFGYITPVVLPFNSPKEVEAVLRPQLDGKLPEEVDDLFLDWMSGGPATEGGFLIHTLAVREERMASLMADLLSVGVDARLMDVDPFHLATTVRGVLPTGSETVAILDIGAERSGLLILDGSRMDYARVVQGGGETITRALAAAFQLPLARARVGKHEGGFIDPPDLPAGTERDKDQLLIASTCRDAIKPLIRRLRESFHAHLTATHREVSRVYLCGGSSMLPGLDSYIGQSLGVPCEVLTADRPEFGRLADFPAVSHRFAGALGLALRGVSGVQGSQFNLRKGRFSFRGSYDFLLGQLPSIAVAAVILLVCGGLFYASRVALLKAEQAALNETLEVLSEQTFGEVISNPSTIRSRLQSVGNGPSLRPENSAFHYFAEIADVVDLLQGDGARVDGRSIEVDLGNMTFTIEGTAAAAANVDRLEQELSQVSCMVGVERRDLRRDEQGEFRFTVQGRVDCSRAPTAAADESSQASAATEEDP
jgi:Tfp pilus assembly PilM family ATPase